MACSPCEDCCNDIERSAIDCFSGDLEACFQTEMVDHPYYKEGLKKALAILAELKALYSRE